MKNMFISKASSIYCVKILIDSIYRILNEFVILEGDQQELWEIDYEKKIAINISDLNIVENKMTRYDGTIQRLFDEKKVSPKSIFTKEDHFLHVLIIAANEIVHLDKAVARCY